MFKKTYLWSLRFIQNRKTFGDFFRAVGTGIHTHTHKTGHFLCVISRGIKLYVNSDIGIDWGTNQ